MVAVICSSSIEGGWSIAGCQKIPQMVLTSHRPKQDWHKADVADCQPLRFPDQTLKQMPREAIKSPCLEMHGA